MTISSTPTASEINVELGRAASAPFSIDGAEERALAEVPTGPIRFFDFIGKSASVAQVILASTMTSGATGDRTGYYVGGQPFAPYGSLSPDTVGGGYSGAQCVGITYVAGAANDFEFWMLGDFSSDPEQFKEIRITGITTPAFFSAISYSDLTAQQLTGGETYYRFDTAGQAIPATEDYNVVITSPGNVGSNHTLTVGQVNANTYGFTKA